MTVATVAGSKKRQIIDNAVKMINKTIPNEDLGRYRDIGKNVVVQTISTGSMAVDAAIGGGIAKGRIINIVGHTSSGKTTLALTAMAELQKEDPDANILFCDAEQTFDPRYAESLGVNVDDIFIIQPSSGEAGYKAIEMFMESGVADLVIVDSVAAMLPKSIIERDYEAEALPGAFAKLTSTAVGRINRLTKNNKCTVILINQWKPVVRMSQFAAVGGSLGGWYQPGGAQLQFFSSQIMEIKKSGEIKSGANVQSSITTMTCKKNKIAPPYQTADFIITYGQGLDRMQEIINLGFSFGFIEIAGSYYKIPEVMEKAIQGRIKFADMLEQDPELLDHLESKIKATIKDKRDIVYKKMDDVNEADDGDHKDDDYYEEIEELKSIDDSPDVKDGALDGAQKIEVAEAAIKEFLDAEKSDVEALDDPKADNVSEPITKGKEKGKENKK